MTTALTSDAALARIKARAQVPSVDPRLADTDIFAMFDDVITTEIGLSVYDADDGRQVYTAADVTLTASLAEYRIPARAWAGGVDTVSIVDSNGLESPLAYVDREEIPMWSGTTTGTPERYSIVGDVIRLLPTPSSASYSLRVRFVRRPNRLVAVSSCAIITAVGSTTLTATYPSGAGWTSVDVIEGTHGGASLEDSVTVTLSGGSTHTRSSGTWASTGAGAIAAGDYVCSAGTSCVIQVPDVAIAFLIERVTGEVADVLGDSEAARTRLALAEQKRGKMEQAIAERTKQRPRAIPYGSPLRSSGQRPASMWGWRR